MNFGSNAFVICFVLHFFSCVDSCSEFPCLCEKRCGSVVIFNLVIFKELSLLFFLFERYVYRMTLNIQTCMIVVIATCPCIMLNFFVFILVVLQTCSLDVKIVGTFLTIGTYSSLEITKWINHLYLQDIQVRHGRVLIHWDRTTPTPTAKGKIWIQRTCFNQFAFYNNSSRQHELSYSLKLVEGCENNLSWELQHPF